MALLSGFPVRNRRFTIGEFITPVNLSPISLLHALVIIAQEISRCGKPKGCQRRNCEVITRRVRLLSILFEALKDSRAPLPPSAFLCFNELYIMLQRTKLFLDDCSEGSRIWLLMQNELISSQFHELTQDMATALDVLPLRLLDVSEDVREQVELVQKQARKATVFVDPSEQQLRKDVLAVLGEFERKVTPDSSKLKRILNHLGMKDVKDCRKEISLLEDEIGRNHSDSGGAEGTVSLITSWISFIRYCKCVLFGVTEVEQAAEPPHKDASSSSCEDGCYNVPDDFRCPITLDLMRDPVIVATGQTYDRVSITRWIDEGHSTCPKSGQALSHTNLIPNHALRNLIHQWCEQHGIPFEKPEKNGRNVSLECIASTKAALEATKMTAAFLVEKLETGTAEVKKQVARELRLLAKCGMDNRACIAEAGAIPLLVSLLSSDDPKSQENAVTALLNLSIHENNKARIMETPDSVDSVVKVLQTGKSVEARENAAATLFSLSVVHEYKKVIGEKPDAIPALVELLRNGSSRGKRDAATALFNLSIFRGNDSRVVEAGAVPLLVNLLTQADDERPGLSEDALAVLAVLAGRPQGLIAISQTSAIPVLVGLLRTGSPKGKENSISILLALCRNGGCGTVNSILRVPSLVPSLYILLTTGTPRAKRKATAFLRNLHRWEPARTSTTGTSTSNAGMDSIISSRASMSVATPLC